MIRTGGGVFSITRICTVLVWLRSSSGSSWCRFRAAWQVEVVQRVAGRMCGRDVEGLEVVPLVLDLRPVGHGEAEPAHDVLQFLDRLRDRV